jgi:hypothetical protein
MRTRFLAVMALLITSGLLSGCIIEHGGYGYRHHHHYEDRY